MSHPSGEAHRPVHLLPPVAVAVDVPVLELDPGPVGRLGDEPDLDLAGPVGIRLDLPLEGDVPREDDPVRRLVGQHPRPPALAAVGVEVDDVAALPGLEHHLGEVGLEDVVLGGHQPPMSSVKTANARSTGTSTTTVDRTEVAASVVGSLMAGLLRWESTGNLLRIYWESTWNLLGKYGESTINLLGIYSGNLQILYRKFTENRLGIYWEYSGLGSGLGCGGMKSQDEILR